ncbi:MAG: cytochrome c oxidase subunit 3 [Phycisphaeraceae bacterium JB051]
MTDTTANPHDVAHDSDHGHGHDPHVAHHFESKHQQNSSMKLGMWAFLSTEILMFGGLFCGYAIYRANHTDIFMYAHKMLDMKLGAINTVILLTSSMTMAWAVRAAQLGQQQLLKLLLAITLLGGFGFLGVKYVEYTSKFHSGLYPGARNAYFDVEQANKSLGLSGEYAITPTMKHWHIKNIENYYLGPYGVHWDVPKQYQIPELGYHAPHHGEHDSHAVKPAEHHAADHAGEVRESLTVEAPKPGELEHSTIGVPGNGPVGVNPQILKAPTQDKPEDHAGHHLLTYDQLPELEKPRVHHFFQIYYLMTGLHVLHVLIGMSLIAWIFVRACKGQFSKAYNVPVDIVGLYWHLVDLIWIFLFPLLYLIH